MGRKVLANDQTLISKRRLICTFVSKVILLGWMENEELDFPLLTGKSSKQIFSEAPGNNRSTYGQFVGEGLKWMFLLRGQIVVHEDSSTP